MPGSIHVLVLEAFDLPEAVDDGEEVVIKVAVGAREFQTAPNKAFDRKTSPWSLEFVFPVLNLGDNLFVMLVHKTGEIISKSEIDTSSIVEKGSFEVYLLLTGGGRIHLSLSFVLTDEERQRIDIMRAAALKRREQEALKSSGISQLVEKESESRVLDPVLSAPIQESDRDIEKSESSIDLSLAASQSDESPSDTSVESLLDESVKNFQGNHQAPVTGFDSVKELVSTAKDSFNKTSGIQSISPQDPFKRSQTATEQMNLDSLPTTAISSQASVNGEVEKQTGPANSLVDSLEDSELNHVKPSPSSVKARIKAFERTRPEGASKQGLPLSSTNEVHMSSPQLISSPGRYAEREADQAAFLENHHEFIDTAGTENKELDSGNQMGTVDPFGIVSENNLVASAASGAESYNKDKDCLPKCEGLKEESNLQSAVNVDHVEPSAKELQSEKSFEKSSKQKRRQIDLSGVSKQVINGAVVGAVSGAVLIAAGALLWGRNPLKRRNTSSRQQVLGPHRI
ncbi:hypothetical protein L7F22_053581 [Adiantum nelumboides]|nr:hypothetical protein [Adiantum nelumboides]